MNLKKLALLGSLLVSTGVPTLTITRLVSRLARPALQRLNIFKPAGLSATRQALPTQARTARLLAGAGAATATAALLSQQPAQTAAEMVSFYVYTTPNGFRKRIIIIRNNNCDSDPEIRAQIQNIVSMHNGEMEALTTRLQSTVSPSYLLIEANEQAAHSFKEKEGQKPETLIETAILSALKGNAGKPQTIFFDKQDSQDRHLLALIFCSSEELLEKYNIPVEQRDAVIAKKLAECAEKNKKQAESTINKSSLPPICKTYIQGCVNEINTSSVSTKSLDFSAYNSTTLTTIAQLHCELFEKIVRQENNTIVVVANSSTTHKLQADLEGTGTAIKALGLFKGTPNSGQDIFVKEDFGNKAALWIKEHEDKFDRKAQK